MKTIKGKFGFSKYYGELFGSRWPDLEKALKLPSKIVARLNAFSCISREHPVFEKARFFKELPNCLESEKFPPPAKGRDNLLPYYLLDPASVVPAINLFVRDGETVLDLCAAPGGKALILSEYLGKTGTLTVNEKSFQRLQRLKRVLKDYVPQQIFKKQVNVTSHDASRWCLREKNAFDKILLDVPCSSERHVLKDPQELSKWSPARIRQLSIRQYAMLASAYLILKPGGRLVYSTCALTPSENDCVIQKLLKKHKEKVRTISPLAPFGELTEYGWQILPDRTGFGPIFFSILEKV